ncbi:hypothetical protein D3C71_1086260 [compost metagenome]
MPVSMTSSSPLLLHAETVMQMAIQFRGFELTEGMHDYLSKRLAYSLNHGAARIGAGDRAALHECRPTLDS